MRPLPSTAAFTILAPDAAARVEPARWTHQARTFLDAEVTIVSDASGTLPDIATVELDVAAAGRDSTRVMVRTFPISAGSELIEAAERGVQAIGGAGFDALVARARRIWQVPSAVDEGDPRAPLVVAALLASVLLGPIVPPDEVTIFGVKGARMRLQARGWPQSPA